MATAERHTEVSALFLEQARTEFDDGDLLQASEKAWGAVAHCVRASAEENDWDVGSHRHTLENVHRMIGDCPDPRRRERMRILLRSVLALHSNFYEAWMPAGIVEGGIDDARELVHALGDLDGRRG